MTFPPPPSGGVNGAHTWKLEDNYGSHLSPSTELMLGIQPKLQGCVKFLFPMSHSLECSLLWVVVSVKIWHFT